MPVRAPSDGASHATGSGASSAAPSPRHSPSALVSPVGASTCHAGGAAAARPARASAGAPPSSPRGGASTHRQNWYAPVNTVRTSPGAAAPARAHILSTPSRPCGGTSARVREPARSARAGRVARDARLRDERVVADEDFENALVVGSPGARRPAPAQVPKPGLAIAVARREALGPDEAHGVHRGRVTAQNVHRLRRVKGRHVCGFLTQVPDIRSNFGPPPAHRDHDNEQN